jgi:hypothetical protein
VSLREVRGAASVFISYRRDDSAYAATAIYERLAASFGAESVFFDVDSIPPGGDFVEYLRQAVDRCDALLVMIGNQWLGAQYRSGPKQGTRRLDDRNDFVRIEIEVALSLKIPVIPVLLGCSLPHEDDLPETLRPMARRNAVEARPGRDFGTHVDHLVQAIALLVERESLWVRKEVQYALDRKRGDEFAPPEIRPVVIEGPPLPPPWPELAHLHFNVPQTYFMSESTQREP